MDVPEYLSNDLSVEFFDESANPLAFTDHASRAATREYFSSIVPPQRPWSLGARRVTHRSTGRH